MILPEELNETASVSNKTGKIYNPARISNTLAGYPPCQGVKRNKKSIQKTDTKEN